MSWSDDFRFRPAKKRPAAYFNDGEVQSSFQYDPSQGKPPHPALIKAIRAARETFFTVFEQEKSKDEDKKN